MTLVGPRGMHGARAPQPAARRATITTIAWDGKTLAADSHAETTFKRRIRKLYRLPDGAIFGSAGLVQETLAVVAWLEGGEKPANLENFEALIIEARGASMLGMRLMREPVLEPFFAVGSGAHFALAAMACGCNAVEAVRIAARFDPGTGGRLQSMKLEKTMTNAPSKPPGKIDVR